jgi:SSS family solute:Na+ symporter
MSETTILNELELSVLDAVLKGHTHMYELIDLFGLGGVAVNAAVERLDEARYIARDGYAGANFWSFEITEKGLDALPPMSESEKKFFRYGLESSDMALLEILKNNGRCQPGRVIVEAFPDPETQKKAAASVVKMLRRGYLNQDGFVKRYVTVNDKGEELLRQLAAVS